MGLVDARIRVHHPCPYCDISGLFPRSLLLLWCDNRRDVFLVSCPAPTELTAVLRAFRDSSHAKPLVREERDALVIVPDFEWSEPPSVTRLARRAGVWVLHPVVYSEGKETYRLIAPDRARLNRLIGRLRRLGAVEVLSISERTSLATVQEAPVASVHFLEGLTDPQLRSLLAAYEGGLLDVPSRGSWQEVAGREGLSRSTFGEHLRKAQLKLLTNSYATLRARRDARAVPRLLPATEPLDRVRRTPLQGVRGPVDPVRSTARRARVSSSR